MTARKKPSDGAFQSGIPLDKAAVILVHGNDEFEVSEKARELVRQLAPADGGPDGLEVFEADVSTSGEIEQVLGRLLSSLRSMSMFSEDKLLWLKNAQFLPEKRPSTFKAVKDLLETLVRDVEAGLPEGYRLIISSDRVSKRSPFYKCMEKFGAVFLFDKPDTPWDAERAAVDMVMRRFQEEGIHADRSMAEALIQRAGSDTRTLVNEIHKLGIYLGKRRELQDDDLITMIAPGREAMPYEFADAVGERNIAKAFSRLSALQHQKHSPVGLIFSISNRFRELSVYHAALQEGWARLDGGGYPKLHWISEQGKALAHACLGNVRSSPAAEGRIANMSKRYSSRELAQGRELIARAHEELFRTTLPKEMVIEFLVIRLILGETLERNQHAV